MDLSNNALGELGAAAIGHGLKENESLRYLNLARNNIAANASLVIADGLRQTKTLEVLHLDQNPLGRVGGVSELPIRSPWCVCELAARVCSH